MSTRRPVPAGNDDPELLAILLAGQQASAPIAAPVVTNHPAVAAVSSVSSRTNKPRKPSAIIRGEDLDAARPYFNRVFAAILLTLSFAGTIIAINGSWPAPWWALWTCSTIALAGGIVIQAGCTLIEWFFRHQKKSLPYIGAMGFDVTGTAIGFGPLFVPSLTKSFIGMRVEADTATILAWIAIVLVSLWLAYYPEASLID